MNIKQLYDLYSLCLPPNPVRIIQDFTLEMWEKQSSQETENKPDSLFVNACNATIDLFLKDPTRKAKVVEFFLNAPSSHLNCHFLRSRLPLFAEIVEQKLKRCDKKRVFFSVLVYKSKFVVGLNQETLLEVKTKEDYSILWPFTLLRIAFLCQLETINFYMDGEEDEIPDDYLNSKVEGFLELFNRRKLTEEESKKRCSYQMEFIPYTSQFIRVMFMGRMDLHRQKWNWGAVF